MISIRPEQPDDAAVVRKTNELAFGQPLAPCLVTEQLIESLDVPAVPGLSAKGKTELRRRCAEVDRGVVRLRAADAVFKSAYTALA